VKIEEVEEIARLSRLQFDGEELERFVPRFESILKFFAELEEVATGEVEPTYHALEAGTELATPTREDEVEPSLTVEEALSNAPDSAEGHFRVPPVIE